MLARKIFAEAPPRFALLGFSLGGIVALEMVAQEPDRVERLCLDRHDRRGPIPWPTPPSAARRGQGARRSAWTATSSTPGPGLVSPANFRQ